MAGSVWATECRAIVVHEEVAGLTVVCGRGRRVDGGGKRVATLEASAIRIVVLVVPHDAGQTLKVADSL